MKTRFYFPMIISLLVISVSLLTACGDSDNPLSDTTKPVIDLKSPAEGGVLAIGSEHGVHFEMDLSDDVMLKSYKIAALLRRLLISPLISLTMFRNKERLISIIMIS